VKRVKFNPLLKKLNFSRPSPARTCGEPGWLTDWNSFWHLYQTIKKKKKKTNLYWYIKDKNPQKQKLLSSKNIISFMINSINLFWSSCLNIESLQKKTTKEKSNSQFQIFLLFRMRATKSKLEDTTNSRKDYYKN